MRALRRLSLLAGLAVLSLWLGCPDEQAGECRSYTDCPSGQLCDQATATCVLDPFFADDPGGGTPNIVLPDAGPGGAGGDGQLLVRTDFPVPWIGPDPRPGQQGQLLVADFSKEGETIGRDQLIHLDFETGALQRRPPQFDLFQPPGELCGVERLVRFDQMNPPEIWLSCRETENLRIFYEGRFLQGSVDYPGGAELTLFIDPAAPTDWARILTTRRGAPSFRSFHLRDGDGFGVGHPFEDDVSALAFGAISGFFSLRGGVLPGDHLVVFDREYAGPLETGPHLVPLQRFPGEERWALSQTLQPLPLPAETHLVHFLRAPRADGQAAAATTPDFMTLEPSTGTARYWSFELREELFPITRYEIDSRFHVEAPPPEARILLEATPSGDSIFYALPTTYRVWRIPVRVGSENDVRFRELLESRWQPSALVPVDDDRVWVSYDNDNLVERLTVSAGGAP